MVNVVKKNFTFRPSSNVTFVLSC